MAEQNAKIKTSTLGFDQALIDRFLKNLTIRQTQYSYRTESEKTDNCERSCNCDNSCEDGDCDSCGDCSDSCDYRTVYYTTETLRKVSGIDDSALTFAPFGVITKAQIEPLVSRFYQDSDSSKPLTTYVTNNNLLRELQPEKVEITAAFVNKVTAAMNDFINKGSCNGCFTYCSKACDTACLGSCSRACVGSCEGKCSSCTNNCYKSCAMCNGVAGCTVYCGGSCTNGCSKGCGGACYSGCSSTCYNNCSDTCYGGCAATASTDVYSWWSSIKDKNYINGKTPWEM